MTARRKKSIALLTSGLAAAAMLCGPAGNASAAVTVTPINTTVGTPYNLAVWGNRLLVADGDSSLVSRVAGDGALTTVATGPTPGEVAGVAFGPDGKTFAYTSSQYVGGGNGNEPPTLANGSLTIVKPGKKSLAVNLATYETKKNPDAKVSYGLKNAPACLVEALGEFASYKGLIDSHPYSVDYYRRGGWVVADAAGNDLLKVSKKGKVSTLAVLPRQPLTITPEVADTENIPATCDVIGKTYYAEAVPTDVEYDGGYFWVTVLPGGPEGADPRGKVYRVSRSGKIKEVASSLVSPTNLARYNGKLYVAEPFAGRISVIKGGKPETYVELPGALSVESGPGRLLVGTGVAGPGSIVSIG